MPAWLLIPGIPAALTVAGYAALAVRINSADGQAGVAARLAAVRPVMYAEMDERKAREAVSRV